LPEQDNKISN